MNLDTSRRKSRKSQRQSVGRHASSLRTYLICSTHRTGSTVLSQILTDTGICGYPEEYFSPHWAPRFDEELTTGRVARRDGVSSTESRPQVRPFESLDFESYLHGLFDKKSTPNGAWGCKLHWTHIRRVHQAFRPTRKIFRGGKRSFRLLEEVFGGPAYLWVQRRDKVRQAISFWRSTQTQVYNVVDEEAIKKVDLKFDYERIHELVERFEDQDRRWERLFAAGGVEPLVIEFESFVKNKAEGVERVVTFLGVEKPVGFTVPASRLKKMSDGINDEWHRRYHEIRSGGRSS